MTIDIAKKAVQEHAKSRGKFATAAKMKVRNLADLSIAYTPGVAAVSLAIAKNPRSADSLTAKRNLVAIVSDGSAVLGLGNVGPLAALPVIEGKALLFKTFAEVDAVPIVLDVHDIEAIIAAVKAIAPTFGGINLEDIAAPQCFEIETRLRKELDIPVFHDDQHGAAIVVLAALMNALKVVKKEIRAARVVVNGAGAAGIATAKLLLANHLADVILVDSKGIIEKSRKDLNPIKKELARMTNKRNLKGDLGVALQGADAFIGLSKAGALDASLISLMANRSIIFALANPTPEIMPEIAKRAGAAVVATGRSDFPNQINNSLIFPGFFRALLDTRTAAVTERMEIAAAAALAGMIKSPAAERILPGMLEKGVAATVSAAVKKAIK